MGLFGLALVLTGGIDAARALGTLWGVQAAADGAAWEVMIRGAQAQPVSAATAALAGVPLYSGAGLAVSLNPADSASWTYGRQVCVSARASWTAVSPLLPGLSRQFSAGRCVYVQKWP